MQIDTIMKKLSLLILFAVAAVLPAKAQKVGFINTDSVMVVMSKNHHLANKPIISIEDVK